MGSDDVLLKEIDICVDVWTRQCGKAMLNGSLEDYYMQKNQISTVQEWRRRIMADPDHEFSGARESAIKLIEAQRQLDESFSIPRLDDGEVVTTDMGLSIHRLLRLHRCMQERHVEGAFLPSSAPEQARMQDAVQENRKQKGDICTKAGPSHLLVEMQMAMFKINEPYVMYFSIYKQDEGFVTEEFLVAQSALGLPVDTSLMERLYTLFANVNSNELLQEGYLVVKIYRQGALLESDKPPSASSGSSAIKFQRPFACGVVSLQSISGQLKPGVQIELPECPIYRPKLDKIETTFSQTHELIIQERFADLEEVPLSKGVKLCLTLVQGSLDSFRDESFLETEYGSNTGLMGKLKDAQVTLPFRSEDMMAQGGSRESIYVTLKGGDFNQGSKSAAKNIEVTACCVNNADGTVVPDCISRGRGRQAAPLSSYASTVFYHTNSPSIEETFFVNLAAVSNILACHLFFTVAHCSTNTKEKSTKSIFGGKEKKARDCFAFCVLPFSNRQTGGLVIPDGDVNLQSYNPLSSMTLEKMETSVIAADKVSAYLAENMQLKPRTLKNGSDEYLSVTTFVHSVRYVQEKAVSDLMSWRSCESEEMLIAVINACRALSEDILAPCVQECIEMSIAILYEHSSGAECSQVCETVFKFFVHVMTVLGERCSDPSRKMASFLQLPTPGGRGEKVHKSSLQEKNHQKSQDNMLDAFIRKIFQSTKSAEVVLLRQCALALTELRKKMATFGFLSGMYESSLVAIVKDTCLIAHYNFRRSDPTTQADTLAQFTAEMRSIVLSSNQILASATKDNRIVMEIRQQFFEILSISESYLSVSENAIAANQYILTLLSDTFARSKTAHSDKMKFIRQVIDTNMFLEIEGRHGLLPTIVKILVENMVSKKDLDGTMDLLQVVLEQVEILGSPAEYVELVQLLPSLVNVTLELCARLTDQSKTRSPSVTSLRRKSLIDKGGTKGGRMRRMSCIGNTAAVTTNSVRISLENATSCLCSLLNLLEKENVTKVMQGEYAVVTKSRVSSLPHSSSIASSTRGGSQSMRLSSSSSSSSPMPGALSPSKSLRVLSLEEGIFENDEDDQQKKKRQGKDFIISLLTVQTLIIKHLIIPTPWLLLSMMVSSMVQNTILWVTEVLVTSCDDLLGDLSYSWTPHSPSFDDVPLLFADDPDNSSDPNASRLANNLTLWSAVFTLSLTVALDEEITLESAALNPARLAYLSKNYEGDVRLPILASITQCWECLSAEHLRIQFGHLFTIPFLALSCSPCLPLATEGKKMIIDLLRADFVEHKCFSSTASHIYDSVSETLTHDSSSNSHGHGHKNHSYASSLIMEKRYMPSYQPLVDFVGDFSSFFCADSVLNCKYALDFAVEINELKTLLQVLSRYPKTTEFEEERSFAYAKLMEFLSKMNRRDAYIKFAHTLAKEMNNFENYVEAGNAILLHAKLLEWTDDVEVEGIELGEDGVEVVLPPAAAWERKLHLLEMSIELMDRGKGWEYCIQLLQEIAELYTVIRPDYLKLARVLEDQAKYYQRIVTDERFFPTMFRVSYYGCGYANQSLINKTFIYRGNPLESIMDFTNRIKKKYPGCELLAPKVDPSEEHLTSDKMFLQISKVTSADPEEMLGKTGEDISKLPKYIKSHRQGNGITCFFYQRPFRKNKLKSANEFLDLWVEKKYLSTSVIFPGHTRRAEVTKETVVVLNPIEMAVIGLEERNRSLAEECTEMTGLQNRMAAQSYTMSLSGTVDAAVNGGIKNYESFITGSYREDNPEIASDIDDNLPKKGDLVARLKQCLVVQMELLGRGIEVHGEKCLESMLPLHSHVETTFGKMKRELRDLLGNNE